MMNVFLFQNHRSAICPQPDMKQYGFVISQHSYMYEWITVILTKLINLLQA